MVSSAPSLSWSPVCYACMFTGRYRIIFPSTLCSQPSWVRPQAPERDWLGSDSGWWRPAPAATRCSQPESAGWARSMAWTTTRCRTTVSRPRSGEACETRASTRSGWPWIDRLIDMAARLDDQSGCSASDVIAAHPYRYRSVIHSFFADGTPAHP